MKIKKNYCKFLVYAISGYFYNKIIFGLSKWKWYFLFRAVSSIIDSLWHILVPVTVLVILWFCQNLVNSFSLTASQNTYSYGMEEKWNIFSQNGCPSLLYKLWRDALFLVHNMCWYPHQDPRPTVLKKNSTRRDALSYCLRCDEMLSFRYRICADVPHCHVFR